MKTGLFILLFTMLATVKSPAREFRIAIAGLSHGHIHGFMNLLAREQNVVVTGIWETDQALADKIATRYKMDKSLFHKDLDKMLAQGDPEAVVIFTSTFQHLEVVEACAPRKIAVMMEKPMATNMDHALRMKKLVDQYKIPFMVNYETTWYPSNHLAYRELHSGNLGELRKLVVHDGHQGPAEIGVGPEFLSWLTDPKLNGGGALMDFGCYGANLATWLMKNEKPVSVTAVTQQIKPDKYPQVDDEATIILTYPRAQAIVQASWNWPFNRKDMEVYGRTGSFFALNSQDYRLRLPDGAEKNGKAGAEEYSYSNYLQFFRDLTEGKVQDEGLSGLQNNLIVVEILEAARNSAKTGKTIFLKNNKY
jgi:predicted dehydrogenase